jgi:hypothetical protein
MDLLADNEAAAPLANQPPSEQLALVPGRRMSAECQQELSQIVSYGVSVAAMLPYVAVETNGRLGGPVVYARDFGARNEMLRAEYGDRAWYRAQATIVDGALRISLMPIR